MLPIVTLTRTTDGWQSPAGELFTPNSEGCVLIPAGGFLTPVGMVSHHGFEIYPNPATAVLHLFKWGTYVETFADGTHYLLLENCEYQSADLTELVGILETWMVEG